MGEIIDLNAFRAANLQRKLEKAKRRERGRALAERSDASSTKPETKPLEDDPA